MDDGSNDDDNGDGENDVGTDKEETQIYINKNLMDWHARKL